MLIKIDMHFHSRFSDGTYSPTELVRMIRRAGLLGGVLTDHENWQSFDEFSNVADEQGLFFTSGVEVSTMHKEDYLHLLFYCIEGLKTEAAIAVLLTNIWRLSEKRTEAMLNSFRQNNLLDVTLEQVRARTKTPGPFVHFSKAYKYLALNREISFDQARELAKKKGIEKAAFEYDKLPAATTLIFLARKAKAKPVLAHPFHIKQIRKETDPQKMEMFLNRLLDDLQPAGLFGIEAYHPKHNPVQEEVILKVAEKRGLLITGGSDFHGELSPGVNIGDKGVSLIEFEKFLKVT